MSRLKNFSRNLATSYLQLGVNVVYSLVSIPLILHWLPRAEFGLWAVLVQLMAYISLVDMGVNQAIARFLVDHKDQRSGGEYGSLIKTSVLVSVAQGLIVLLVVTLGSPFLAGLMKIPPEYQATFIALMRIQGVIAAFTFCTNPLVIILNAHQRMDLVARQGIFSLVATLILLFLFLRQGCGIYSFIYAGAATAAMAPCYLIWECRSLAFLPRAGEWGQVSWHQFKEVFLYGKDIFLMNLGAQLITTSQTIIISRTLGLETAAAWSVGTKIYTLIKQIVFQPYSAAIAGLSEMSVRKETGRLRLRFKNLVVLTASLGVFTGVAFVLCNSLFVTVWTSGKIIWSPLNDVLLAAWLFVSSLQCTHCNFVSITKQIGGMRYLYFAEGCCFVILALFVGSPLGLRGIIGSSIVCTILFSNQYGWYRSRQYFNLSFLEVAFEWVRPSLKLAVVLIPLAFVLWLATANSFATWRLVIHGAAIVLIGGPVFLRIGLPPEVVRETQTRIPEAASRLLEILVPRGV